MKLIYLILIFPLLVNSQNFGGKYVNEDRLTTTSISFQDSFEKSSGIMLAHGADLSKGNYSIKNDTIVLEYLPYNKVHSKYEIYSKKDSIYPEFGNRRKVDNNMINLNIMIFDIKNNPITNPIIVFKSDNKVLGSILTNGKNQFNYFSSENSIDEIMIMKIGFEPLTIKFKKLRGYITDIKTYLVFEDQNTYNLERRIEKYIYNKKKYN